MIYTITLNPAIDHVFETDNFNENKVNYYHNQYQSIGGKGINIAKMLKELSLDVVATGLLGKNNLKIFSQKFKKLKLKEKFIVFEGDTRINYHVIDSTTNNTFRFNGKMSPTDLDGAKLLEWLNRNLKSNDLVVVSGSVPHTITPMIYHQIGVIVKRKQAIFILDSSSIEFKKALKTSPFLVKQTIEDTCKLLKLTVKKSYSQTELKNMIQGLKKLGAQNVLLSLSEKEGLYYNKNDQTFYKISGIFNNSLNPGDFQNAFLVGFIYGYIKQMNIKDTLKYAGAISNAYNYKQTLNQKTLLEEYINGIKIRTFK